MCDPDAVYVTGHVAVPELAGWLVQPGDRLVGMGEGDGATVLEQG